MWCRWVVLSNVCLREKRRGRAAFEVKAIVESIPALHTASPLPLAAASSYLQHVLAAKEMSLELS